RGLLADQGAPAELAELQVPLAAATGQGGGAHPRMPLLHVQEPGEMRDVRVLGADHADAQHGCSPRGPGRLRTCRWLVARPDGRRRTGRRRALQAQAWPAMARTSSGE